MKRRSKRQASSSFWSLLSTELWTDSWLSLSESFVMAHFVVEPLAVMREEKPSRFSWIHSPLEHRLERTLRSHSSAYAHLPAHGYCTISRMDCATLEVAEVQLQLKPIALTQDPRMPSVYKASRPERDTLYLLIDRLSVAGYLRSEGHCSQQRRSSRLLLGHVSALLARSDGSRLPQLSRRGRPLLKAHLSRAAGLWARQVRSKFNGLDFGFEQPTDRRNSHHLIGLSVA